MLRLTRSIRFCVSPGQPADAATKPDPHRNGYAAFPRPAGLARYYELHIECEGQPDANTGYLIDIKAIDRAVRATAIPMIASACEHAPTADPASMLPGLAQAIDEALPVTLASLTWAITPTYTLELRMADQTASQLATSPTALMRQRFDFAAAHRLHVPTLSDEDNRAAFGKCNNPSGHGHNYGIEPCVAINLDAPPSDHFTLADLERLVDEHLIEPFDHTHLNADTKEFATDTGVNPSVENIARVFFDRLKPAIAAASSAAELRSIRVWETDRTSCTYPST